MIAACLLHDVLEDSEISLGEVERASSKRTAALVLALTKPSVVDSRSRAERNLIFLNQISDAGPTARFIKACDASHNLSRPESVPIHLLEKSIEKSAAYVTLADIPQVGTPLIRELRQRVARARQTLDPHKARRDAEIPSDIEQIFRALDERSSGKTLEVHDISELLVRLTGALHVKIGPIDAIVEATDDDRARAQRRAAFRNQVDRGWFKAQELKLPLPLDLDPEARCLAVEVGHLFDTVDLFVLAAFRSEAGRPLGPATFRALVLRSFDRLRGSQHQRWLDVHAAISRLSLHLEPDLALRASLSIPQLAGLAARLESGEFVRRNSVVAIERFLAESRHGGLVDRLESRTKTAQSIVQKMTRRQISSFDDLDDLVGLRIIAASKKVLAFLIRDFRAALQQPASDLSRMISPLPDTISDRSVNSSSGYSAHHICFQAQSPSAKFGSIACEVQFRTVHEDAWARVSHLLTYKEGKKLSRAKSALRELAFVRDKADETIDDI